jgi:hypothetical protein
VRRGGIRIALANAPRRTGGKEAHVKKKTDAKQVVKGAEDTKAPQTGKKRGRKQVAEMLAATETAGGES